MPESQKPHYDEDERSEQERATDHALKDTFPASDPLSSTGGTATPSDAEEDAKREPED